MPAKLQLIVWVWVAAFFIALAAHAGTTGKIAGTVKDATTGEPVIGAAVLIEGTNAGAAADVNGEYFILNVPPGKVTLRVQALGYAAKTMRGVQVISDQTSTVDFDLQPESLQGEEVIIVAEKKLVEADRTFATATVGASDMEVLPITNLNQVVELQAGVVDGHFRGGRKDQVLYLVDGISVTDVYDNSQGTQVDNRIVEELQVISGTFNAEYGQAMSGVVNIVTREGSPEFHGAVSSEMGDYLTAHHQIFPHTQQLSPLSIQDYSGSLYGPVPRVPKLTFFVSGRYQKDSGWLYGKRRWQLAYPVFIDSTGEITGYPVRSNDSWAEMNPNLESFGHAKLSYDLTSRVKLTYSSLFSSRNYRDYDHAYRYVPDGDLRRYRDGRTNILKLNHALSGRVFYETAYTNSFTSYEHFLYEDPYDPRYVHPGYADTEPPYSLNIGGNNVNRFRRWTNSNQVMGNLSWQANKLHLLKFGLDVKFHRLFYEDINLVTAFPPTITTTPNVAEFHPVIEDISTLSHDRYVNNPYELALYVQDKYELKSLIVNAGLRLDYFEPDGKVLADPRDPNVYYPLTPRSAAEPLEVRLQRWYRDADAKWQISPRLGIAYPMSDKGVFHFAYGHFIQRPTFERMYTNPEYELEPGVGLNTVMGNPDLKMEETVTYEFGFQQEIASDLALNTTLFYRDIRNLVASDRIVETYSAGTRYSQYVNRSFGEVKGITVSFDKRFANNFSAFVDYTYQTASGDASDPQSAYNDLRGNREPQRQLVPLGWDRRHTLNASVSYATAGRENWGLTMVAKYGSGLPYTPQNQGIRTGFENDGRKPGFHNLDLSAFKTFPLSPKTMHKLVLTLTVLNLLDTKNEDNVYSDTGRAGYSQEERLAAPVIRTEINTLDEVFPNPSHFSRPRMVKLGVRYEF